MTNLIFDYDGTLHDCIKIYASAFRAAYSHLVSLSIAENKEWEDDEISRWLGFSSKDMWDKFMPSLPQSRKNECSQLIGNTMLGLINEGKARLYTHTFDVLQQLTSDGYTLIFLSNCKHKYMQAHRKQFHLDHYFSDFYCAGDFMFMPKYKIFNIINSYYTGEFIVIGDRFQDMEIAQKHGLKSIGCSYGYGEEWELTSATIIISDIADIIPSLKILKSD